ncbi:MAG: anthranilate synthase component I family protein [Bacteroidetes bacterium]|nr:anthranilate synthase component I family protein [Bacteroidota bacterium]
MLQKLSYTISSKPFNINIEALNKRFNRVCVFDSNPQVNNNKYLQASQLIAVGCIRELIVKQEGNALEQLQQFINENKNWIFGYLTYDLKNEVENLNSRNTGGIALPALHFFVPQVVLQINNSSASIFYDDALVTKTVAEEIYELIFRKPEMLIPITIGTQSNSIIKPRINKQEYIDSVNQLKQHIRLGDIYEINFCQEFFAENIILDTVNVYEKLNEISRAPFTAYCKFGSNYLLCASPERFIQKQGNKLISQPIKGTIRRAAAKAEDEKLKNELQNSKKERSENIMIVDLVRNDLSRIAKRGNVNELFGVYSFKQVHQLISTVTCEVKENISFTDIIKSTFPMGSMTGAPKVSAMKLIDQYESSKRGLYSGAVGYITPTGDFDFNVVIRSILYDASNNYLSFMVGSAIIDKSDAELEYEECLLKAKALFEVLEIKN